MSETIPGADDGGEVYGFTKRNMARVADAVKRLEGALPRGKGVAPLRGRWPVSPVQSLVPAELTASLAAGTKGSPSSAAATTLVLSGSGPALTTTGGQSITVYRTLGGSSLASGKQVLVFFYFGRWYLFQADC